VKHIRWVTDGLTDAQKASRVFRANELLGELRSVKHHDWELIVTFDESWFHLATNHEQLWLQPDDEPPERPRHMVQDHTTMVTMASNPLGFHLLNALPKGSSFAGEYYRNNILAASSGWDQHRGAVDSVFMPTMRASTLLENVRICLAKSVCASSPTHPTPLILHHPISSYSDMSSTVWPERPLHHAASYSRRFRVW
jgi:hypothetical protein